MPVFHFTHKFFKTPFSLSTIIEWSNLDKSIRNSLNLSIFLKSILKFIRHLPNSAYNCFNTKGLKRLARLRLGLKNLRDQNFSGLDDKTLSLLQVLFSPSIAVGIYMIMYICTRAYAYTLNKHMYSYACICMCVGV